MNMTPSQAVRWCNELKPLVKNDEVDVVFCVPQIDIVPVVEACKGTNIKVGGENMFYEEKGAFTGEVSAEMLVDAGAEYVVLGHSERRTIFHETNEVINRKVSVALEHGLIPILCCGETLLQRQQGVTMETVRKQVKIGFYNINEEMAKKIIIAYEPIWAIGTGVTATANQAQEVCGAIRDCIREIYDDETADAIRILYGGSVNGSNAAKLFAKPDIDGGLVGGAALKPEFSKIVNYEE
ncbi:MAG: triose-phosphate isomerase [Schaedlerella sp.]|nr:triose-phosphate isomerase [Schaedlerella sp.]